MTMILWGRRNSANVQKALWALEELGLSYERRRVGGGFGGLDDPAYRALNPNGVVPTLQDGALTLWESDAILRHLARTRGAGALRPEDLAAQALADQWLTWGSTTLFPALAPLFYGLVRTARAEQDVSVLGPAAEKLAATLAILDARLARAPFVAGESFSFGDIGPAIVARRAVLLPWGAPHAPNVARWLDRIRARRAFQVAVDFPIGACQEEWAENEGLHG